MGITKQGIEGEQMLFKLLRDKSIKFFQPDAIGYKDGKYNLYEVKHQAMFKKPPFDGHGLPKWQVEARLKFQKDTTIRCVFVVFDSEDGNVYYQYLDVLEECEYFDTKGLKPRRVYNIKYFIKGDHTGRSSPPQATESQ